MPTMAERLTVGSSKGEISAAISEATNFGCISVIDFCALIDDFVSGYVSSFMPTVIIRITIPTSGIMLYNATNALKIGS